jgi:hypothetical protein
MVAPYTANRFAVRGPYGTTGAILAHNMATKNYVGLGIVAMLAACGAPTSILFSTTGFDGGTADEPPDSGADSGFDSSVPMADAGPDSAPDSGPGVVDAGQDAACALLELDAGIRYINAYAQPCDPCTQNCIAVDCSACTLNGVYESSAYNCNGPTPTNPQQDCATPFFCESWGASGSSCGQCFNFECGCLQFGCSNFHP